MKSLNPTLIACIAALVLAAVFTGSHFPQDALRHEAGGPTLLGYKVIVLRCGFFFMALTGFGLLMATNPPQEDWG